MSSRKVAKRACDGCKVRKVRCDISEVSPCTGCVAAGIACTTLKPPAARGPRRLRRSTLQEITETQQQWESLAVPPPVGPVVHNQLDTESVFAPSKVAALALQLCVYRLRCYAVWPIIKVERLLASLQKPDPDIEVFALAYAVAAATIAQIRTKDQTGGVTAEMMEAQCQFARVRRKDGPPDLTTCRIPFFLHIYYENLDPGGLKSITYLREAIAVAHMIGLHRESYYANVELAEQEIRRRTLWLLFVTERGVSIRYKLPVTIKTKIAFPSLNDTDEREVLMAYQKLISMFWHFDQAGVFELLDSQDFDLSKASAQQPGQTEALVAMRKRLDESVAETQAMNDIQAVDMVVTRSWMRIIIWRLAESHGFFSRGAEESVTTLNEPITIAIEMLVAISHTPDTAIEAHGHVLEMKVFEIASSVADAITLGARSPMLGQQAGVADVRNVLLGLQQLLSRNARLQTMLRAKMEKIHSLGNPSPEGMTHFNSSSGTLDLDIEQQLQAHGFDFTDPMRFEDSPDANSDRTPYTDVSPREFQQFGDTARGLHNYSHQTSQGADPFNRSSMGWEMGQGLTVDAAATPHYLRNMSETDFNFNGLGVSAPTTFSSYSDGSWDSNTQMR